ncbi:MAG: hypothetical protein H0Z38_06085 [Firmicutes bacterium]|nr:hypothetical protein [Bacillota bacterium]
MSKIIYIHLPTFYAKMQIEAEPSLSGKPVVIDEGGFVKAASPEALSLGIYPGTRTSAARHSPGVEVRPYNPELYRQRAVEVWDLAAKYSPLVEPDNYAGLFLDLTGCGNPSALTAELAALLWDRLGLVSNIGRATNKFLAKLAAWEADWYRDRPGLYSYSRVILPGSERSFLADLPVSHLWPLKPKTTRKLASLGLYTIGEVARLPEDELLKEFGREGKRIARLCRGDDQERVLALYPPPKIEHQEAFVEGCQEQDYLAHRLCEAGANLASLLRASGRETRRLVLVLETETGEQTCAKWLVSPTSDKATITRVALNLLNLNTLKTPVTGFVLRAEEFQPASGKQLGFFTELMKVEKEQTMDDLLSTIKDRFGLASVDLARAYEPPRRELILSRFYS